MDVDAQKRRASPSSPYHTRLVDLGISLLGGIRAIVVYYETNVFFKKIEKIRASVFCNATSEVGFQKSSIKVCSCIDA